MTTPMIGPHRRRIPGARSAIPTAMSMVTANAAGAAFGDAPAVELSIMSKTMGMTVTAISMMIVPATAGVMIRRTAAIRRTSRNWKNDEATTSVASRPGPPSTSAVTHTEMNAPDVPIMRTWPAPRRPSRTACSIVVSPLISSAPKTDQATHDSAAPAARAMMSGVMAIPPTVRTAAWTPRPAAIHSGGRSSGW